MSGARIKKSVGDSLLLLLGDFFEILFVCFFFWGGGEVRYSVDSPKYATEQ